MKKSVKNFAVVAILLTKSISFSQSNSFATVNLDSVSFFWVSDTANYLPLIINTNGNIIIAGNSKISSTQYDAVLASQTNSAVTAWITSFNTSNQKAFFSCSTVDGFGNIYTAGAVNSGTTAMDFLVIKSDIGGNVQWIFKYDYASLNDVASAIYFDDITSSVYVTGASEAGFPSYIDFVTIKIDANSGTSVWQERYDNSGYFDIPTGIEGTAGGGNIIVTGASGTSPVFYEATSLSYDDATGTLLHTSTYTTTNAGQDKLFGVATDTAGNVYVAGSVYNGVNYDAFVQKLDTSLIPIWTQTIDAYGFDDFAFSVALDDSLNVYIAGTSFLSTTRTELTLHKFTTAGSFRWKGQFQSHSNIYSEGLQVKVKSFDEIFVGGNMNIGGNKDILLTRFNNVGYLTLEKRYDGASQLQETFMDLEVDGNKVYISARSFNGVVDDNILIHYSYRDHTIIPDTNVATGVPNDKNEIIIEFNKSVLKMGKINNKEFQFGSLSDFVEDSTCTKIANFIWGVSHYDLSARNLKTKKVFPDMTSYDTTSISRMGIEVEIPKFYTHLIVSVPTFTNFYKVVDSLKYLGPDIFAAQPNYLYQVYWAPNDVLYPLQASLHTTTLYPDAHISCEGAWDYTKGNSTVKVGVYDTGVDDSHPDFGGAVVTNTTYIGGTGFTWDIVHHGTNVAGIIGAKSNNSTVGMAGIAGGDGSSSTPGLNDGVSLVNMKVFEFGQSVSLPTSTLMQAFKDGATSTNAGGQGLHIMNYSLGRPGLATDPFLVEGLDYINRNGVAFVAARGQLYPWDTYPVTTLSAPATLKSYKVMNVGASGTDGNRHVSNVNGNNFTSFEGKAIDFIAPGAHATIRSTESAKSFSTLLLPTTYTYTQFGGTSAAAPHVSGVVGLMMSYRNSATPSWDNIVHEDCEALLKRAANDLTVNAVFGQSVGVDSVSGYGRINANATLAELQSQYKIRHIDKSHYSTSQSVSSNTIQSWGIIWSGSNSYTIPSSSYSVYLVEVQTTYAYNYSGESYIDSWPLYKASKGFVSAQFGLYLNLDEDAWVEVVSASMTSAIVKTYVVHFTKDMATNSVVDYWLPAPPSNINSAFTLYSLGDPESVNSFEPEVDYINLYPNPTTGDFTLGFSSRKKSKGTVSIQNLMGAIIYSDSNINVNLGLNRLPLTVKNLPKGIYFITLDIENNKKIARKVVLE